MHNIAPIELVSEAFQRCFGHAPDFFVRAPGRINLIGEHTDYNAGLAIPAAIDRAMYFGFSKNDSSRHRIYAQNLEAKHSLVAGDFRKSHQSWKNYLTGALLEFRKKNLPVPGFDCCFYSDIPVGAGLSSSAALECGFIKGLDRLVGSDLSKWDIVTMANEIDHTFLGVFSGILDQFACVFGEQDKAMLLDCKDRTYSPISIQFDDYRWVLIDSKVKHEHLTSGYNDRVAECNRAVNVLSKEYPHLSSLRDVTLPMLDAVEFKLSDSCFKRAKFISEENQRVVQFQNALRMKDYAKLGGLLYDSHEGLENLYEVSSFETDLLVDFAQNEDHIIGARMMGGGFGGCTLNLVQSNNAQESIQQIIKNYKDRTGIVADAYFVKISNGVEVLGSSTYIFHVWNQGK